MIIAFFVLGLLVGSFINVVVCRIDDLKSIVFERSHCPNCKKIIKWYDLVPLLSFVILRGRCRFCKENISWQYPIVEFATGLIFALLVNFYGLSFELHFYLVVACFFIIIASYDAITQLVPEVFIIILAIILLSGSWYFSGLGILNILLGSLIGGAIIGSLAFFSREKWMGYGDVEIGAIIGLLVGFPRIIPALFLSFVLGSIFGLVMVYFRKGNLKSALAFTPFLLASGLICLIYGNSLINWYLGFYSY